jgi:putative transposase
LTYLLLRQVLQMLTQLARDDGAKEVELLVLRHQVAVLRRQITRPKLEPADRVVLAALSRLLPARAGRSSSTITRPGDIQAWHGDPWWVAALGVPAGEAARAHRADGSSVGQSSEAC